MDKRINKDISDALHFLLNCSLKDTKYETQKEAFYEIHDYIYYLEQKIAKTKDVIQQMHINGYVVNNGYTCDCYGPSTEFSVRAEVLLDMLDEAKYEFER